MIIDKFLNNQVVLWPKLKNNKVNILDEVIRLSNYINNVNITNNLFSS